MYKRKILAIAVLALSGTAFGEYDHSDWENPRIYTDKATLGLPTQVADKAACAVYEKRHFKAGNAEVEPLFFLSMKDGETLNTADYKYRIDERITDREWSADQGYHSVVRYNYGNIYGFDAITAVAVQSGCSLRIEGEKDTEYGLPQEKGVPWVAGTPIDKLNWVPAIETKTGGKIKQMTCSCGGNALDVQVDRSTTKASNDIKIANEWTTLQTRINTSYNKLDEGVRKFREKLETFESSYNTFLPKIQAAEAYSKEKIVTYEKLKADFDSLDQNYRAICRVSVLADDQRKLSELVYYLDGLQPIDPKQEKVDDSVGVIRASRVFFSQYTEQLPVLAARWQSTLTLIEFLRNNYQHYTQQIGLDGLRCQQWAEVNKRVVNRIRDEQIAGVMAGFQNLDKAIVDALLASANTLAQFDLKIYWTFLVQQDTDALSKAMGSYRYNDILAMNSHLFETYKLIVKSIDESPVFPALPLDSAGKSAKDRVKEEFRVRVLAAMNEWKARNTRDGQAGTLRNRVFNVFNPIKYTDLRIKLYGLPSTEGAAYFTAVNEQLKLAGFRLPRNCTVLDTALDTDSCWIIALPTTTPSALQLTAMDKALDVVEIKLEELK